MKMAGYVMLGITNFRQHSTSVGVEGNSAEWIEIIILSLKIDNM